MNGYGHGYGFRGLFAPNLAMICFLSIFQIGFLSQVCHGFNIVGWPGGLSQKSGVQNVKNNVKLYTSLVEDECLEKKAQLKVKSKSSKTILEDQEKTLSNMPPDAYEIGDLQQKEAVAPDFGDGDFTHRLGRMLSVWLQNKARDGGVCRFVSDTLVTASIPSIALSDQKAAKDFLQLTREKQTVSYGEHERQVVDLLLPNLDVDANANANANGKTIDASNGSLRGLVFFVHGGAWGSGMPWMYRLIAKPFLDAHIAVAVVGYRTYPDGNVQDQINDLEAAAKMLYTKFPYLCQCPADVTAKDWTGVNIIGHSSGAHVAMMALVERIERCMIEKKVNGRHRSPAETLDFDTFIGMSGAYSISNHYEFEIERGVQEFSPMKAACGYTKKSFDYYSPAMRLQSILDEYLSSESPTSACSESADNIIHDTMPEILLLHGVNDDTVPFTSSEEAGRLMRECGVNCCEENYLSDTGHADLAMELMLGGNTQELVMDWIENRSRTDK